MAIGALACQQAAASAAARAVGRDVAVTNGQCNEVGAGGQGSGGSVDPAVCVGAGAVSSGPMTGQIATMTGPTISGPALVTVVQAGGDVGASD
jgi:hypothetical protein